jgi:hypothetical protein
MHKNDQTHRSKTTSNRDQYHGPVKQNTQTEYTNRLSSTRAHPKKIAGITGINTYLYEVKANPMKEVLLHSIQERKKALNISLNNNSRISDRSKSGIRPRYNLSRSRKFKAQTGIKSFNDPVKVLDEKSIFDKHPQGIKVIMSASVDMKNNKFTTNSSLDFKPTPLHPQSNMHARVTDMLQKRRSRFTSNPRDKQYNISNNTRQNIALRILSKLQDWPSTEHKTGKSFKKFYWTKDYSYCAFAKDEEIVDGFLVKP